MAVGITILSGTRQGEELAFDQPEFRAGDDPACELFFDPRQEPGASEAMFRLGDDGWYVKKLRGAALLVNNHPIETSTRLRSGDVVRLAAGGPSFTFKLLARLPPAAPKPPAESKSLSQNPTVAQPAGPSFAAGRPENRDTGESSEEPTHDEPPKSAAWCLPVAVVAGVIVGLIALGVVVRRANQSAMPQTVSSTAAPGDAVGAPVSAMPAQPDDDVGDGSKPPEALDESVESGEAQEVGGVGMPPPAAQAPQASSDDAVFLLLVEEPKSASAWPFGSAAAIAERTLLTSATVAGGLAGFREKGWRLWASNQRLGLKVEMTDLRAHAAFVSAQGAPEKQIYVDLGLLTVADALPKHLDLATIDELAQLDRGMPVWLLGYLYENEPIDRFQTFLPEPHAGKIFVMTALPPSPGGPRLMHVRAELGGKLYGAPILNRAGHIVGVFAETAVAPAEQQGVGLQIHYAPVADREQIDRWIVDRDEQWWVRPEGPKADER